MVSSGRTYGRVRGPSFRLTPTQAVIGGLVAGMVLGWVLLETTDVMLNSGVGAPGGTGTAVTIDAASQSDAGTSKPAGDTIHSIITSSGSGYQNWQGRIMYGTYKLVQKMPGGDKLTGFTRVLHRGHKDECMDEIPTFHAIPLHPECDTWCDFPVADRPNAVGQWLAHVKANPSELKGAWVAILECDYVWMRPLQAPGDAYRSNEPGRQFHFGYIQAQHPNAAPTIQKLMGGRGDVKDVPNSGPAPAMLRFSDLESVVPTWEKVTAAIEEDPEAVKLLGWVREMYAWDIAIAQEGVAMLTEDAPVSRLIIQPPSDHRMGAAAMCHYTWGAVYNDSTHQVWSWDKRVYTDKAALKPQPIPMPPAWEEGKYHLQEFFGNRMVTKDLHDTLAAMLAQMNAAIDTLPDLTATFDSLPVH
mmetsp:Transcript_41766/g.124933  ORF Transcript_41766/g.124933 Transcript_41766/m.124933 type:complete len:415 (-) Transcript_41766:147-1391(-)